MSGNFARSARAFVLLLALAGCSRFSRPEPPTVAEQWTALLAHVASEVQDGRYGTVERLLREFQQSHPNAPEAAEALFYRALYRLEPANPGASAREAGALLDTYLSSTVVSPRRVDAVLLRHLATALETRLAPVPTVTGAGAASGPREDTKGKDDEIARLKDELSKANAELERIKRRVAKPKP